MKQKYFLLGLMIFFYNLVSATYLIQVSNVDPLTGGGVYMKNQTPNVLQLPVWFCAFGASQPQVATSYTISWYKNSVNSTSGGVLVSQGNTNTLAQINISDVKTYLPDTSTAGTFYYYAVLSNPSSTGCGMATSITSTTQQVVVQEYATHLNFDGVNDMVVLGSTLTTSFVGKSEVTLEAWVRPNTLTGYDVIIGNYDFPSTGLGMQMLIRRDNTDYVFWVDGGTGFSDVKAVNSAVLNTWQHVVGTWDGVNMRIYVDGVLKNTLAKTGNFPSQTTQFVIGGNSQLEFFNGDIDEVRIWDVTRTIEQINGSKNCELQGTETGLVAYYNFNQGLGGEDNAGITTLTDATANANNGTLTGFALNGVTSNWLAGSLVTTGSVIPSAPLVTTPVVYNEGASGSALSATIGTNGTGLLWYTVATGGTGTTTAPTPSTATAGSTSYWVTSTNANGCESERMEIVVNVNAAATHLNFDGTDDSVNLGTGLTSTLSGSNFVTAEAWIFIPNTTGTKTIVGNHQASTQFNLRVINNQLNGFLGFGAYNVDSPAGSIVANTWQHVAMVYNDTTLKLYINGVEVASTNIPVGYSIIASAQPYRIGHSAFGGEYFNGSIDEVRIWNVALSQADIQATMNCEAQVQPELVAYYKFNQGFNNTTNTSVTTLTDIAGSNNGTLSGFALTGATSNWKSGSPVTTGNTCSTLSTSGFEAISTLKVYPNPSTGIFNVSTQEDVTVEVYDLIGKVIAKKNMTTGTNSVDISSYQSGVYLLRATNGKGAVNTYKIVKQ